MAKYPADRHAAVQGGRVVEPPQRSAFERDAVGTAEETVQDGVAEGGMADDIVPVL